jgi:hypothetical protein
MTDEKCDCDNGIRPNSQTNVPLPDGFIAVEKCDECDKYLTDLDAAKAFGGEAQWIRIRDGEGLDLAAVCKRLKPTGIAIGDVLGDGVTGTVIAVALQMGLHGMSTVVLCKKNDTDIPEWISWIVDPDSRSCFWGHYSRDLESAMLKFAKRAGMINVPD